MKNFICIIIVIILTLSSCSTLIDSRKLSELSETEKMITIIGALVLGGYIGVASYWIHNADNENDFMEIK